MTNVIGQRIGGWKLNTLLLTLLMLAAVATVFVLQGGSAYAAPLAQDPANAVMADSPVDSAVAPDGDSGTITVMWSIVVYDSYGKVLPCSSTGSLEVSVLTQPPNALSSSFESEVGMSETINSSAVNDFADDIVYDLLNSEQPGSSAFELGALVSPKDGEKIFLGAASSPAPWNDTVSQALATGIGDTPTGGAGLVAGHDSLSDDGHGQTASSESSKTGDGAASSWLFVVLGLGLIALGVLGLAGARRSR